MIYVPGGKMWNGAIIHAAQIYNLKHIAYSETWKVKLHLTNYPICHDNC